MNLWGTLLVVYLIHMVDEFQHLAGIAPLVIIPGHQLYKPGIEHDTGLLIKDGSTAVADEVAGYQIFIGIAENASSCLRWLP